MRIYLTILCLSLVVSCASPAPRRAKAVGLEPPVTSPSANLSIEQRIEYWQTKIPAMTRVDRAEAYLVIGELQIEAKDADAARISFYQALGGQLSASEAARAEKGIGLSYFLSAQPSLGSKHLKKSIIGLDAASKAEASYLMSAYEGQPTATASTAVAQRMRIYLVSAGLKEPGSAAAGVAGAIRVDMQRSDWHAATMRSNWDKMTAPFRITVHHTAEPFSSLSSAASGAEVKNIQDQHMNGRTPGWADIGYHFLIDRAGKIIAGRPLSAQGAHASGNNNIGNIGICLLGNFASQPNRGNDYIMAQEPSSAQILALTELVDALRGNYSISGNNVFGHKELKSTDCPGPALSRWVANYRRVNL
ncbi:MAG: hypothetical protein ACI84O_001582 [Myxococcota bacterium]|jgi:hypothetical protein